MIQSQLLDRVEQPTRPSWTLPSGACDAHAHVFGPVERFPWVPERSFDPPLAPFDVHMRVLRRLGFQRGVVVQGSCYGVDNACVLDAVARAPRVRRGIGVVDPSVSDEELERLRRGGVVGMRFIEMVTARYGGRKKGAIGFDELVQLGSRLKAHGMHASIDATCETIVEWESRLLDTGIPLVIDHVGRVADGATRQVSDPGFQRVLRLVAEGRLWAKLTIVRGSRQAPDYEGFRPQHDALIDTNPRQLLWGTDWPLILMGERTPDLGHLLDVFQDWTMDQSVRDKILVDNPQRLYGFEDLGT